MLSVLDIVCPFYNNVSRYGEKLLKLEDISLEALKEMTDEWKTQDGKPFDPQQSIHDLTGKIITSLVDVLCVKKLKTVERAM